LKSIGDKVSAILDSSILTSLEFVSMADVNTFLFSETNEDNNIRQLFLTAKFYTTHIASVRSSLFFSRLLVKLTAVEKMIHMTANCTVGHTE